MPLQRPVQIVIQGSVRGVPGLSWSPDGSVLVTTGDENQILVWNAVTGALLKRLDAPAQPFAGLAFSPGGDRLSTALANGHIALWDIRTGDPIPVLSDPVFNTPVLAWSRDRASLACASADRTLSLWDSYTGKPKRTLNVSHEVYCISWSPDSRFVAAAGNSARIGVWNAAGGGGKRNLDGLAQEVFALAWSPNGKCLASGGDDNYVYVWDVANGVVARIMDAHTGAVVALDFSFDGRFLASKGLDGTVRIWNLNENTEDPMVIHEGSARYDRFPTLAFHPQTYAIAGAEWPGGRVRVRSLPLQPGSESVVIPQSKMTTASQSSSNPTEVFVSYSHKNKKWMDRFREMLTPLLAEGKLKVWDDSRIQTGSDWRAEIDQALRNASVAILLVSPEFLASDFIVRNELYPLLEAAKSRGVKIWWVAISDCLYHKTPLESFQAANDPAKPLDSLNKPACNKEIRAICEKLAQLL